MKILAIHNFHRKGSASGDDQVFKSETALLESHGNKVIRYTVSNDEFDNTGFIGKLLATLGMLWSSKNYKAVQQLIAEEKPDIVHVHTFFPLLSPSILYAAKRSGVKVVATFHYICLNENQIRLLINIGFNRNKITKKYNFVSDAEANLRAVKIDGLPERYVVFYGRIGEEKGIKILMEIWNKLQNIPLVVMGGGPLEIEFKQWADRHDNVYFLGYTQHDKCLSIVKGGEFVVFPSIWYEGCSMVEIETESLGKGLIATDLGFSTEAIEDGRNGYKVKLGDIDGFRKYITELWSNPELISEIGRNARLDYEQKYRPEDNYKQLLDIYRRTMEQ